MFERLSEVLSSPAWSGSLTRVQVDRFLRFKAFMFHLAIFLWHILLNYQCSVGIMVIFFTRMDLVNKSFGLGIQYVTIWNQIIQQTYFNACLLQDILEFTPKHRFRRIKAYLKEMIPFAFTSFVFPFSFLVFINFWAFYPIYPQIIDEDDVTATFFPTWVNHGLHTTIIVLVCIEKFVTHRRYSTKLLGLAGMLFVILSYAGTCCFLYVLSGIWPYPLFRVMNNIQRISYLSTNILIGFLFMILGEKVNRKIWGSRAKKTVPAVSNEEKKDS